MAGVSRVSSWHLHSPLATIVEECELPLGWPGDWYTFPWEVFFFCVQIVTVWIAFMMLPYSNDDAVATRSVLKDLRRRCGRLRSSTPSHRDAASISTSAVVGVSSSSPCASERSASDAHNGPQRDAQAQAQSRPADERVDRNEADRNEADRNEAAMRQSQTWWRSLFVEEEEEEEVVKPLATPTASTVAPTAAEAVLAGAGTGIGGHRNGASSLPASARMAAVDVQALPRWWSPRTQAAWHQAKQWGLDVLTRMGYGWLVRNRDPKRGGLLRKWFGYELRTATLCLALVLLQAVALTRQVGVANASWPLIGSWGRLEVLQMRNFIYWLRILYALLSLPYVVFIIPLCDVALTHARPTAYDSEGRCVRMLTATERTARQLRAKERAQKQKEAEEARRADEEKRAFVAEEKRLEHWRTLRQSIASRASKLGNVHSKLGKGHLSARCRAPSEGSRSFPPPFVATLAPAEAPAVVAAAGTGGGVGFELLPSVPDVSSAGPSSGETARRACTFEQAGGSPTVAQILSGIPNSRRFSPESLQRAKISSGRLSSLSSLDRRVGTVLPSIRSIESFVAGEFSDADVEEGRPPMGSAVEARPLFVIATVKETSSSTTPRPVSMPSPRPAHSSGRGARDMV